jgi:hypothetical protein
MPFVSVRALEEELEPEPSRWQRAALSPEEDDYATAPRRQSRGATRA